MRKKKRELRAAAAGGLFRKHYVTARGGLPVSDMLNPSDINVSFLRWETAAHKHTGVKTDDGRSESYEGTYEHTVDEIDVWRSGIATDTSQKAFHVPL